MALDYIAIGTRLKKSRINKHLTQQQLAEKLDISVACLSRIECGKYEISLKRLEEICGLLNIELSFILDGTSPNSSNYLNDDFSALLKNCPPEKIKLIYKIAKTIIEE